VAVTLDNTSITYSDSSNQTTAFNASQNRGTLIDMQVWMAGGSYTWYKPTGCTYVQVKLVGGGGGGCGYCESGGAGGYAEGYYDVTGVGSVAVTVGGGGGGTGYYQAANDGGTTSFGGYLYATGGYGANRNYSHSGGHGGNGVGGQINLYGAAGRGHNNGVGSWTGGVGGGSYFGGGATNTRNHGHLSSAYQGKMKSGAPGTGGPGAQTDGSQTGGNGYAPGESGMVVVYAYS